MKVVVSKDEDAKQLLYALQIKEHELSDRFTEQDRKVETAVMRETMQAIRFVVISWLQEQGFKVT